MQKASSAIAALSSRAFRAVVLIVLAVLAIAATSFYYLRPWFAFQPVGRAVDIVVPTPAKGDEIVTYNFISPALGWAVLVEVPTPNTESGPYWVFKTVDGAKHWDRQFQGQTRSIWTTASSLQFLDARTGFVIAGDPMRLRKTLDGGRHWTEIGLPTQVLRGVRFVDPRYGWLLGMSLDPQRAIATPLFATSDGGVSWSEVGALPLDATPLPGFRNSLEGWIGATAYGHQPHLYRTDDGGLTWQRLDLPKDPDMPDVDQASTFPLVIPGGGVMVLVYARGQEPYTPHAYKTADEGISWTLLSGPTDGCGDRCVVQFQDAVHWWLTNGSSCIPYSDGCISLYKTSDGGDSWTAFKAELTQALYLSRILDARHAWGLAYDGTKESVVFTADGGLHWTKATAPSRP